MEYLYNYFHYRSHSRCFQPISPQLLKHQRQPMSSLLSLNWIKKKGYIQYNYRKKEIHLFVHKITLYLIYILRRSKVDIGCIQMYIVKSNQAIGFIQMYIVQFKHFPPPVIFWRINGFFPIEGIFLFFSFFSSSLSSH